MSKEYLEKMGFSGAQIDSISDSELKVIQNFYNPQEINHIDKDQVIAAAKLLAPLFKNLKIVNMRKYVGETKPQQTSVVEKNKTATKTSSEDLFLDSSSIVSPVANNSDNNSDKTSVDLEIIDNLKPVSHEKFEKYIKNKYLVQQVWILEYLVNNPNLLTQNDNIEKIKRLLNEKELELKLHNHIMQKFIETVNSLDDIHTVLNFKHFKEIKKDMAIRLNKFQQSPPLNFKGVVEILREFGFEDKEELNVNICSILAELVSDPKLQKLIKYTEQNFKEVDLGAEKKKLFHRVFKE